MSPDVDFPSDLRSLEPEYELIREIGQGGMAAVYLARHRATGRLVAIKAVRARYLDDPDAIRRFAREARTVASLDHPNIVRTEAIEQIGDRAVAIIMEHIGGGTVRDRLRDFGSLGAEESESILRDVANALGYAHRFGIVHRDVKPENIFLDPTRGRALLSDFGIARPIDTDAGITLLGAALGTPQYMSPEQIDGEMVDGRSDIYSLGVLGWELLTGRRPWAGENLYGVIYKQKHEDLPRITSLRPRVPANLLFAIEGALAKDRNHRWQTTDEFLHQLTYNPPPLLSQPYPASVEPADYEPTVRFRRADLEPSDVARGDGASAVPDESLEEPNAASSLIAADVAAGGVREVNAIAPALDASRGAGAALSGGVDSAAPNAIAPVGPGPRRRAARVAGLLAPLAIVAGATYVLLGGNSRGSPRVDQPRANVNSSAGSLAPDSAVREPMGARPRGDASLAASPPPERREAVRVGTEPTRSRAGSSVLPRRSRNPPASARPRVGGSTTAISPGAAPADRVSHPESARVVAPALPNDSAREASVVRPPDAEPAATPVADPFKLPPGRESGRGSGVATETNAVPSPRCRLASTADQQACLTAYIAVGDAPLERAFESLVDEMRRVSHAAAGGPDPVPVQRIRVEQRAWMSIRDGECPRSAPPGGGPFWAAVQAGCFNEMAAARAAELKEAVKRLRRR
jgi:serine/threonine protein kinase/uncharacterized protein YecT (DUF1311 family)